MRTLTAVLTMLLLQACSGTPIADDGGVGGGGGTSAGGGGGRTGGGSGGGTSGGGTGGGDTGGGSGGGGDTGGGGGSSGGGGGTTTGGGAGGGVASGGGGGTTTGAGGGGGAMVCPPPAGNSALGTLPWGQVDQLRMASGFITSYEVPPPMGNFHSVVLTQGQQPSTPAGVETEFYVSRCPGVVDPNGVPQCYYRSVFVNNNAITIYRSAVNGWTDQATLGANGCWAPSSAGTWYVNVRWTYPSCQFASCGFSMQWTSGGW